MKLIHWVPAGILCLGAVLSRGVERQQNLPLVQPLADVVPAAIDGFVGSDLAVTEAEARVAGFSNHLLRIYGDPDADPEADPLSAYRFSVYVGYYETQAQGQTIHSPRNCLPGAGWEALSSDPYELSVGPGTVTVNRYVLQNDLERAVVFYWYQGRGRVAHNEYRVKLDLLLDSALRNRSDEALVRVVVPVGDGDEATATKRAARVASLVMPAVEEALPPG